MSARYSYAITRNPKASWVPGGWDRKEAKIRLQEAIEVEGEMLRAALKGKDVVDWVLMGQLHRSNSRLHGGACQGDDTPPSWPAAGRCVPKRRELGEKKEEEASLYKEVVNEGGLNDARVIGGDGGGGGLHDLWYHLVFASSWLFCTIHPMCRLREIAMVVLIEVREYSVQRKVARQGFCPWSTSPEVDDDDTKCAGNFHPRYTGGLPEVGLMNPPCIEFGIRVRDFACVIYNFSQSKEVFI
ncbi:hypothetical protein AGABI2DRAFT_145162 [Agaricus bisporus var. bisporus H97]|uniref:hypothetical protein n=1 Tax=Agaricus bisporus var. bisporus (strain H97 / ATCC MYA-4626 / FGSC 10389) TaxID=936046 RepID=UPI00029F78BA|nr:hypothetical protein AGABI2DRAFT_145162 [Agaricus bisporus var. bisporus H97]EKV44685.1 hypothetical protein AGABI2DRAFT_145162 [Agaricus bisporus var. bisporus H97]